jgi:hypothetical protein
LGFGVFTRCEELDGRFEAESRHTTVRTGFECLRVYQVFTVRTGFECLRVYQVLGQN